MTDLSTRTEHLRAKLRPANLIPNLTGHPPVHMPVEPPPRSTYADGRDEALTVLARLGAEPPPDDATPDLGDLIRQAYALGWRACESRLASPDVADGIAQAIRNPENIVGEPCYLTGDRRLRWQVQAVQRVCAHGVPKDAPWAKQLVADAALASRDRGEFGRAS